MTSIASTSSLTRIAPSLGDDAAADLGGDDESEDERDDLARGAERAEERAGGARCRAPAQIAEASSPQVAPARNETKTKNEHAPESRAARPGAGPRPRSRRPWAVR